MEHISRERFHYLGYTRNPSLVNGKLRFYVTFSDFPQEIQKGLRLPQGRRRPRPVFKKNPIDALDQETLLTINKFFENNLNVSETARKLFVHRNTLVYRLEKIKKLTGLDLREFDDAITFKVALMVKKYLISRGIES